MHVTINKSSMYATITKCEVTVHNNYYYVLHRKLATVHMLPLLIIKGKLQYVCYNYKYTEKFGIFN